VTLTIALRQYLADQRYRVVADTREYRRRILEHFVWDHAATTRVAKITRRDVERWLAAQNNAPSTVRQKLSVLRGFFTWCAEENIVRTNPTVGVKAPRSGTARPRCLTDAELDDLWAVLPDTRAECIVALALHQGLRRVEIARVQVGDLDLATMTMRVMTAKAGNADGVEDWLPISQAAWDNGIRPWLTDRGTSPGPLVWNYHTGRELTPGSIGNMVNKWFVAAGIKQANGDGRSLHALRHTRAQSLLERGADPQVIQKALRHRALSSTWQYLRAQRTVDELRTWMDKPPEIPGQDEEGTTAA